MILKLLLQNSLYKEFDILKDAEELLFANGQKPPFIAVWKLRSLRNSVLLLQEIGWRGWCGWRTKMSGVSDIGRNTRAVC